MFLLLVASALAGEACPTAVEASRVAYQGAGIALAQQGQYADALPCFQAAANADDAEGVDWFNLGSVHTDLARQQDDDASVVANAGQAVAAVERGLELSDPPAMLVDMHARNLFIIDRQDDALAVIVAYLPRVEASPGRDALIDTYGALCREPVPTNLKGYAKQFEKGADLVYPYLGLTEREEPAMNEKLMGKGIKKLDKATALHPRSWAAWWTLGMAHQALEQYDEAVVAFERAYAINPVDIEVSKQLVLTHLLMGHPDRATASDAAVALHPMHPEVTSNHALVLLMRGDTPGARTWVDRSLALDPNDAVTKALAGRILDVENGLAEAPSTIAE